MSDAKHIRLIDVADTPAKREQGMMFIKHMEKDAGMLFQFDSPKVLSFWMKDTYVPLDIAFIDHQGTIVKTESMIPLSTRSVTSGRPCVMALEVPMGAFERFGEVVGKRVMFDREEMRVTLE